jgi:hypothetical protein
MDYALFAQMLLNRSELNGTRILGEKTVEPMTTDHLPSTIRGIILLPSHRGLTEPRPLERYGSPPAVAPRRSGL